MFKYHIFLITNMFNNELSQNRNKTYFDLKLFPTLIIKNLILIIRHILVKMLKKSFSFV